MVALAVRLIPPHNAYHDLKTGVTSEDIVGGHLSPNNINASWITGESLSGVLIITPRNTKVFLAVNK